MKKYASFEKYLQDNYYNEIFRAISDLVYKRGRHNGFYTATVLDPTYFKVDDVYVKKVTFHSTDGNQIKFNAAVEADVILRGMGKRDYEADMNNPWFTVSFIGYLNNGLSLVTIIDVTEYYPEKFDKTTTLSKYLVPYLYSDDLEMEAEKFLQKYCRKALKDPMPIPIEELLVNMGLELFEAPLPSQIFGKTYFAEALVDVYAETGDVVSRQVEPGTILINPEIFFMRGIGSRNNTIIHECVHWDRHAKFVELQRLLNSDFTSIACETTDHIMQKNSTADDVLHWIEWQANALTPRILLPAVMTRKKLTEILQRLRRNEPNCIESNIMEEAIQELADFFSVSKFAAKLRAIQLGFVQAQGVWNYDNGKYLPNFTFDGLSLKKDESYLIDYRNACFESTFNEKVKKVFSEGEFVFVDNMICINDEKYVREAENGCSTLTDYARQHIDECCLKFKLKFKGTYVQGDAYYTQCFLCKEVNASSYCECSYIDDEDNQDVAKRAAELMRLRDEGARITNILRSLPMSFAGTLDAHMKRLQKEDGKKMTNLELALRTGFSDRYIQDLRKEEKNISFGAVCAICIGLHLHPVFSVDLIHKSRNDFPLSEEGFFNRYLIEHHYMDSLDLCNEKLMELGYRTWGKEL